MLEFIIIVILLSLVLISVVTLIILTLKGKNNKINDTNIELDTKNIELSINKELLNINETLNNKFNKLSLENKESIDLSKKELDSLNKEVNDRLTNITSSILKFKEELVKELTSYKDTSKKEISDSYTNLLALVTSQLDSINKKVDEKIGEGFKSNTDTLTKVTLSLGNLIKAQENLDKLSTEVTSLNNVLTNSQTRGRFGEVVLESILNNVFGETRNLYELQYEIINKNRVVKPDAIIRLPEPDKMICIDSKFSFVEYKKLIENESDDVSLKSTFRNELKAQINKISEDYIIPNETSIYAIMFIPNDGIYTYLLTDDYFYNQVIEYARKKNVIITSPSTLQPILANVRMLKVNYDIAKNIKDVLIEIKKIGVENDRFFDRWNKVGKTIETLKKEKDELNITADKMHKKTENIIKNASKDNLIDVNEIKSIDGIEKDED